MEIAMRARWLRAAIPAACLGALLAGCGETQGPPGAGCTLRRDDAGSGATITCGDGTAIHVADGLRGADGADGTRCTLSTDDAGVRTIACGDGTSVTVTNGASAGCTVMSSDAGVTTVRCTDGTTATINSGANGANGMNGASGVGIRVADRHGAAHLLASGEYADGAKTLAVATITAATAAADGRVTVDFRVEDRARRPITTVPSISANIGRLAPAATGEASNRWLPYIWRTETAGAGPWPAAAGTTALQAYRESNGTLTNHHDGTYSYAFATNLTTAMRGTTPVGYTATDRALTHRVVIMMGGHAGATADAFLDFVPAGGAVTQTRNIVETASCQSCHAADQFHGHDGDMLSIQSCQSCHVPGASDANSGNSLDLRELIHKVHAGVELTAVPGPDGVRYDNPATTVNEAADNGSYALWGAGNVRHSWEDVEFPAVLANCTKCHTGAGAQVEAWRSAPSRAACGSCHDNVNFAAGTTHVGGVQANDGSCNVCHRATGGIAPITEAHAFTTGDVRNLPEFTATLTMNTPARGYYVTGEAPVVTLVLTPAGSTTPIDHRTVVQDTCTGTGCVAAEPCERAPGACAPADGLFSASNLFVHGPRRGRNPVLTTAARSQVFSATAGPWDLSAAGASLTVQFDRGLDVHGTDVSGGDVLLPANVTVAVPATGAFASRAAATAAEVAAWLNGNAAFRNRGIAWVEPNGRVGVRSRNLASVFALQLSASAVTTAVFGGDVAVHNPGGSTPSNVLAARMVAGVRNAALDDPKVTRNAESITYQLDPVTDLRPGTYMVGIEFSDRGRVSDTVYRTPTVARITFQVGTATEELAPANGCGSCHENAAGAGFVLDPQRHNKHFNNTAVDMCGQCHDNQQQTFGAAFTGAVQIARRVHAVHGAEAWLNYPNQTIGHADTVPGRNWQLPFPQDIRNCQTCHAEGATSGSWMTNPNRLACGGCHDSDAATAHLRAQIYDPTPAEPYSGDEVETCNVCH